jgi:hypothetical protein
MILIDRTLCESALVTKTVWYSVVPFLFGIVEWLFLPIGNNIGIAKDVQSIAEMSKYCDDNRDHTCHDQTRLLGTLIFRGY